MTSALRSVFHSATVFLALSAQSAASAELDTEKLKLISCKFDRSAESQQAFRWMDTLEVARDGGRVTAGPLQLEGACLKNVEIRAGQGLWFVTGDICNKSFGEFRSSLNKIGIDLEEGVEASSEFRSSLAKIGIDLRDGVAVMVKRSAVGTVSDAHYYAVTKERVTLPSWENPPSPEEFSKGRLTLPTKQSPEQFSFFCFRTG